MLLGVTVTVTTAEFIEIQKLSADDQRARFKLPASCEPSLTALSTDPTLNRVTVAVECRPRPDQPPPAPPGERGRPSAPARKGS